MGANPRPSPPGSLPERAPPSADLPCTSGAPRAAAPDRGAAHFRLRVAACTLLGLGAGLRLPPLRRASGREGELGRTPEGGGRAASELAGPRGGRRGPGSARQRERAARCPRARGGHRPGHSLSGPRSSRVRGGGVTRLHPWPAAASLETEERRSPLVTQVLWAVPTVSRDLSSASQARSDK